MRGALTPAMAPIVLVFFIMVVLDATGTLVAVGDRAGLDVSGATPRSRRAFASDALGTVVGAALGTSTVTSYIESAAGVEEGGRTGLTSLVVAGLFLAALFVTPLIEMVASYRADHGACAGAGRRDDDGFGRGRSTRAT